MKWQDIKDIADPEKRKCVIHKTNCNVEKVDMFVSGFSCTSLSPLNKDSFKNTAAISEGKAGCPS